MEINSAVAFLNAIVVQPSLQSSFKTFLSLQHISIKDTCTPVADSRDCMARNPEGYSPCGHKESDTTVQLTLSLSRYMY